MNEQPASETLERKAFEEWAADNWQNSAPPTHAWTGWLARASRPQSSAPSTDEAVECSLYLDEHGLVQIAEADTHALYRLFADLAPPSVGRNVLRFVPASVVSRLTKERDEALEAAAAFDACKDLSKQGWSALSDARLFLNLGQRDDIEEAKQGIDLAQASFADTIIEAQRRAEAAESRLSVLEAKVAEMRNHADACQGMLAALLPDLTFEDEAERLALETLVRNAQKAIVRSTLSGPST